MLDPVTLPSGITYDRSSIEKWIDQGHQICPSSMMPLPAANPQLVPNHTLRRLIQNWCVANQSLDAESIPSLKPPAEPHKVRLMLQDIDSRTDSWLPSLRYLRTLTRASEQDKRCIEAAGAIPVMANLIGMEIAGFHAQPDTVQALQEAIGILVLFSLDETTRNLLKGTKQLATIVWILNRGTMDARVNAASLLETLAIDRSTCKLIIAEQEAINGLIRLLREDLYYAMAVKASLNTLLALCRGSRESKIMIAGSGAIPILMELLPGTGKSMAERILALVAALSLCSEGRAAVRMHALAIPVLIRSLLVVSEVANEQAVVALWAICLNASHEETLQEAAQMGAMQKLLVLAQMDCTPQTKQRTQDLLRALSRVKCKDYFSNSQRI